MAQYDLDKVYIKSPQIEGGGRNDVGGLRGEQQTKKNKKGVTRSETERRRNRDFCINTWKSKSKVKKE